MLCTNCYTQIDDDSAIFRLSKNDCVLFVRPIQRGVPLRAVKVDNLEQAAPFLYHLGIPTDLWVPEDKQAGEAAEEYIRAIFSALNNDFTSYVFELYEDALSTNSDLFAALLEVTPGQIPDGKPSWSLSHLTARSKVEHILGIDNLLYWNISKQITVLDRQGFHDPE
jgi:hypothetical protein